MSDAGRAAINRPLTEPERNLLTEILVWKIRRNIASQGVSVDHESTVGALEDLTEQHGMERHYDTHEVHITVGDRDDRTILTVARPWLAFHASPYVAEIDETELERALERGDIR